MTEPEWMWEGTEFSDAFDRWQSGSITYSTFCKFISTLEDVPQEVKDNHNRSCEELLQDINKAIFLYKKLRDMDAGLVEDLLQGYEGSIKYGIV